MTESQETHIDFFEGFDEELPKGTPLTLEELKKLADLARQLQKQIQEESLETAKKQEQLNKIVRDLLPAAMEQLGIKNFTLEDDSKIKLDEKLNAYISEENKEAAFNWLTEHNFDAIIKTKINSEFGKGEIDEAKKALEALENAGFSAKLDRSVHPQTLKSFVKERLEKGEDIPLDIFGVFEFKEVKITPPKKKS